MKADHCPVLQTPCQAMCDEPCKPNRQPADLTPMAMLDAMKGTLDKRTAQARARPGC